MSVKFTEKDHGWKRILKELPFLKKSFVKVGILSSAGGYATGGGKSVNLADVATFNEFGTSSIPPRPFMGQGFDNNRAELERFKDASFSQVLEGKSTVEIALQRIGVFFKGKIQQEIASGYFKENSPVTIAMKGSSKPLIDTGRLRQSIQFELELKK